MQTQDGVETILNWGEFIREERKAAGLTLKQLGAISGVSFQTISHWEHGHVPPVDKLDKVLKALRISITLGKK